MKKIFLYFSFVLPVSHLDAQGKYITIPDNKKQACKIYIDQRVIDYAGSLFTATWSGPSKAGYADGDGRLAIDSKVGGKVFHLYYDGHLTKGKKEGNGNLVIYQAHDSNIFPPYFNYTGDFHNDELDGRGEYTANWGYQKGSGFLNVTNYSLWRRESIFHKYKGMFSNGRIADTDEGEGTTFYLATVADETVYKGQIRNARPNGEGEAYNTNPISPVGYSAGHYKGGFVNGKLQGQGKLSVGIYVNEGSFADNQLSGKGKVINNYAAPGSVPIKLDCGIKSIEADFSKGKSNGLTVIYFQNCDALKFEGFTTNGAINGSGKVEYLNGDVFRGNFSNDKKEGKGVYQFSDGVKFEGSYANNDPVYGTYSFKDGSWYEGQVRNNVSYKNGEKINTLVMHGQGTMHKKDGSSYKVNCSDGNCQPVN